MKYTRIISSCDHVKLLLYKYTFHCTTKNGWNHYKPSKRCISYMLNELMNIYEFPGTTNFGN